MATVGFDIVPHDEAVAEIRNKPVVSREVFDAMLPEVRARAFTVTGLEPASLIQRVRDEVATIPAGADWETAKKNIVGILDEGHFGAGAERRAELLVRMHGFQAYSSATWRTGMEDPDTTHWQYLTMEDARVRPGHRALDGVTLPKHDPFWRRHFPPWDWGCRCRVRGINQDLLAGIKAQDAARPVDAKLVIEGPSLQRLRDGQIERDGQTHDVTPPSERQNGGQAFQWHPSDLRIPLDRLREQYADAPDAWNGFEHFAKQTPIAPGKTIWDWLLGASIRSARRRKGAA